MKAKVTIWIVTAVCILGYAFAYWCEAAYFAGKMGFSEVICLPRLLHSLPRVAHSHFVQAGLMPTDVLVLLGAILVAIFATRLQQTKWRWLVTLYTIVLVSTFGWMGVLMLLLPGTIDGEYFAENCARLSATGLWALTVSAITIVVWCVKRRQEGHRTQKGM